MRDGDWKYLRIAGNEFLFDVVQDPRERANLKDRSADVFDRLKRDWEAWNATMLAERPRPANYGNPGRFMADHYGVVDPPVPQRPPGGGSNGVGGVGGGNGVGGGAGAGAAR